MKEMNFNEKLQKLRKEKKYSQEELADMLDVTRQSVSKWESGQTYPEMDKLLAICKIFGCTLEELTNDSIKLNEFAGEKKSKVSDIASSVEEFIEKTYHYFTGSTFKDILKCLIIMFVVYNYTLYDGVRIVVTSSEKNISTIKKNSETKQKDEEKEINNQDIYDYKKKISELESQVDELERNNRELSDKIDDYKRKISALSE